MTSEANLSCSDDEVSEVVELSIAASEAVLIHEIISGLVSDSSLAASQVLEAASRLKEARSSVTEEELYSGNVSDVGYITEMGESSMAEAYDDVGLLSIACNADLHAKKMDAVTKTHTSLNDDIKLEVSCIKEQQKLDEDQTFEDGGDSDKCKKRWYGDWIWKEEMKSSVPVEHLSARVIPELFTDVTSFLSESGDIASDENSFVHRQATNTLSASQLSTGGGQAIDEKSNEYLLACSSSLPSNDPLCSVVPCSISCDENSLIVLNHGPSQHYSRALECDSNVQEKSTAKGSPMEKSIFKEQHCSSVHGRKRVRFIDPVEICVPKQEAKKQRAIQETCYFRRNMNWSRYGSRTSGFKRHKDYWGEKDEKRMIFENIEFLITGFSNRKEKKLQVLIRMYNGILLSDIPSSPNYRLRRCSRFNKNISQVVISPNKLQTIKFLFGCATNAFILRESWIIDSVAAGFLLSPDRYSIIPKTSVYDCSRIKCGCSIFVNVGVMLHGKNYFCTEMAKVIQHGGGHVFNSLQSLSDNIESKKIRNGVIVAENERCASRHLKHCALEHKIPMLTSSWIIKSLQKGKLLPPCEVKKNKKTVLS